MNANELLDVIGGARDQYVSQAIKTRETVRRRSFRKPLLIAALIALMLTLVGCGVAYAQGWFASFFAQRSKTPLTKEEVEYIDKIEQPVNETMSRTQTERPTSEVVSQDGYTLRVKSVMTDGYMAYITIGITGPKNAVLSKTVIPGYDTGAPAICAGNFMEPGFFELEQETVRMGYTSMGAVEDHDGLDHTQDLILTVEAEMEDGTQPFAADKVWKLHIEDLLATYFDLEAQKELDAKYGGEYISFTGEDGIDTHPKVILAKGGWDFEISFADNGSSTVELIAGPVTANICIGGKFEGDPDVYKDVEITSFVLSSLSATVKVDTDGFPDLCKNGKSVYAVMKDGSRVELRTRSYGPGELKLEAELPIDLEQTDYVLLADGTELCVP